MTARLQMKIDRTDEMPQCKRDNSHYEIVSKLSARPEDLVVDKGNPLRCAAAHTFAALT